VGFEKRVRGADDIRIFHCEKCETTEKLRVLKKSWETVERTENHP
jgi:hypothetical protein